MKTNTIRCEVCQGTNIVKQDELFICLTCGVKYTTAQLSALLTQETSKEEASQTESSSNSNNDEKETLFRLARRAREDMNAINGEKYYGELLKYYPNDWEVVFFQVYFQAFSAKVLDMPNVSSLISNSLDNIYILVTKLTNEAEQHVAACTINRYLKIMVESFSTTTSNLYTKTCGYDFNALSRYTQHMSCVHSIYIAAEKNLKTLFPNFNNELLEIQKAYAASVMKNSNLVSNEELKQLTTRLENEIKSLEPEYVLPETNNKLLNSVNKIKNTFNGFMKNLDIHIK